MIVLLSPAKTFNNLEKQKGDLHYFLDKSNYLVDIIKQLDKESLQKVMKISNKLTDDVYKYYQNYSLDYQAAYLYGGQAYKYLKAETISNDKLKNLYILSPLYGIINALDKISHYRLDLKDKLISKSLTDYWFKDINDYLNTLNKNLIINLASGEFSKLLDLTNNSLITINFAIFKDDKLTQPSMAIKKMRGMMAKYILENEIESLELIKEINLDGFKFNQEKSTNNLFLFTK